MSAKPNAYWPMFLIVAALSTAAVWRFAPMAPLPQEARAFCVKWTHKARQSLGLEAAPAGGEQAEAAPMQMAPIPPASPADSSQAAQVPAAKKNFKPPTPIGNSRSPQKANPPQTTCPHAVKAGGESVAKPMELKEADDSDDALAMTPEQRKRKYDELTKLAEARRMQILRDNLAKSPEGQKALAAVKKFKEFAAKVDELKKKYGETDSRVVSKRGDLLKLKDEVRRTNEEYKKWKEKNPDKFVIPEEDMSYRKLIGKRQLYSD